MALSINNNVVVDDSKNALGISSITFADASVQTTAGVSTSTLGTVLHTGGSLINTIDNPNPFETSFLDSFSTNIATDGKYIIVSASGEDDSLNDGSGKAYIFDVVTGALVNTLSNPNAYSTTAGDNFGTTVAISGNFALVSAYFEDDTQGTSSGKVYVFDVITGSLLRTIDNPNVYSTSANDRFGLGLAVSGNYAIVTSYQEDDASGTNTGKAHIYNVTTGALLYTLNNPNAYGTVADDRFGWDAAMSGNYAIISSFEEDDAGGVDSGKAYIYNVTTGALVQTLNNPNAYSTSVLDRFGYSVDISGNYAIVSAPQEDDINGITSGKAYIFNVTTGALVATLNNPNAYSTSTDDEFGFSVGISGNYAIVGAYNEDDAGGSASGKAYIFNATTGALLYTLNNPNAYGTSASDNFGYSVSIAGDYAVVGAYQEDDSSSDWSGKVYTFAATNIYNPIPNFQLITLDNGVQLDFVKSKLFNVAHPAGALIRTFDNPNAYSTSAGDWFGATVAISGNYAIVGVNPEDDIGGTSSGKAYIFNVTTGALVATLNNPNAYSTSASDTFGTTVAISGNYAIVGAPLEDDSGGASSGKAYIFNVTTGALVQTLNNPNTYSTSAGDQFGISVAISGNYAIVGAYQEDDSTGSASGKAYIFNVTTGALLRTLNNPNAYGSGASDTFGTPVAISGNYAIVSAYQEDDAGGANSGKAYIFNVTTGALLRTINNPNAYSTSAGDTFGTAVDISGNYAIVGAFSEDDAGGSASGKAYIFNASTGALLFTLNNPNVYSTGLNDSFGYSVAISGNYAIVSASSEDDTGGSDSGKAYIYNVTSGALLYTLDNPNAYTTSAGDYFGQSVAISGNYAIVGAYNEGDIAGFSSGKVYLFSVTDQTYLDKIVTVGNSIY